MKVQSSRSKQIPIWYMKTFVSVKCGPYIIIFFFLIMAPYFVFEGIVCMVSTTIRGRYVGAISFCVCMQCQVWPAGVAVM